MLKAPFPFSPLRLSKEVRNALGTLIRKNSDPSTTSERDAGRSKKGKGKEVVDEYYRLAKRTRYPIEELVSLASMKQGQRGRLVFALGGAATIRRLCDLGLIPETEVLVLKKGPAGGPIIVEVRSCEIAIGGEIASKVLVKPL